MTNKKPRGYICPIGGCNAFRTTKSDMIEHLSYHHKEEFIDYIFKNITKWTWDKETGDISSGRLVLGGYKKFDITKCVFCGGTGKLQDGSECPHYNE